MSDRTIPIVHLRLVIDAGSYDDGAKPGVALLTALTLARGAAASVGKGDGWPFLAARMRVEVAGTSTVFSIDALDHEAPDAISLLGAMLGHAAFRQVDSDSARRIALERPAPSPAQQMTDALRLIAAGTLGPNAPADQPPPSFPTITGLDVQTFYRTHYGASRAHLIVVGRMDADVAIRNAESAFGSWNALSPAQRTTASTTSAQNPTFVLFDEPAAASAEVLALAVAPSTNEASWQATWLATAMVRSTARAECVGDPRFASTLPMVAGRPALFPFCFSVVPQDAPAAIEKMLEAAKSLGARLPDQAEMLAARKEALDALAVQESSDGGIANLFATFAQSAAAPDLLADASARLRAVAPSDVATAARTNLSPSHWFIAVRGPASALRDRLARIGTVRDGHLAEPNLPASTPHDR